MNRGILLIKKNNYIFRSKSVDVMHVHRILITTEEQINKGFKGLASTRPLEGLGTT